MKNYGVDMQGKIRIEVLSSLPTFSAVDDQRRLVYNSDDSKFYIGTTAWKEIAFSKDVADFLNGSNVNYKLDGDRLDINYTPSNYTRTTSSQSNPDSATDGYIYISDSSDHLASHLNGINTALGNKASTSHGSSHIRGQSDEIDGDKLDIDWNPYYYTPATTPSQADNLDNLTSHLYGIDQAIKNYSKTKYFCFVPYESDDDTAVFDGTVGFCVPPSMDGMIIKTVTATTYTAGVGGSLAIQLRKSRAGTEVDILSTKCTIDTTEYSSTTAATAYVIDDSGIEGVDQVNELLTGDLIFCDIDTVHSTTPAQGLSVVVEAYIYVAEI